jgi:putative addiction module component (TIGR02574 family)
MPMARTINQIVAEARQLSPAERADLAQQLFATLEDEAPLEAASEIEEAWLQEAERRYQSYLTGDTTSVPAAEALARVRHRLWNQ